MKASAEDSTISAAHFKAKCLQLINDAHQKRQGVVITKRGVPMARLIPYQQPERPFRSIFGRTPGNQLPSKAEWKTTKDAWEKALDESTRRLARQVNGDFREKR